MQIDEHTKIEDANSKNISDMLADFKQEFQKLNLDVDLDETSKKKKSRSSAIPPPSSRWTARSRTTPLDRRNSRSN